MAQSCVPCYERPRNFQWYWKSSDVKWEEYLDVENEIIEDAHNERHEYVDIDGGYTIDLKQQVQEKSNSHERWPIKRDQFDKHLTNVQLRKDRFSSPITISTQKTTTTTCSDQNMLGEDDLLKYWLNKGSLDDIYRDLENADNKKTISDLTQEASNGIIQEGISIGEAEKARWLARQLNNVKNYGENMQFGPNTIPSEIGKTLVNLYTRDTFWCKLINSVIRDLSTMTRKKVNTIGPFCVLLRSYINDQGDNPFPSIVYRGLTLTDEERKNFMKEEMRFTAFTSTSKNRTLAELLGNTLLIIDLNVKERRHGSLIKIGRDISMMSNFPEEEEYLIIPRSTFNFEKYEYDESKDLQKHIVYLKGSNENNLQVSLVNFDSLMGKHGRVLYNQKRT
ncbi:unnamed protein product [Rotaria magnacalcarata]|uniref:NAD(P)(+)--arginine ADP-ribosyltransferase n=1 Tax=Rotaria magnacalcarata TaxID=392030 RepID=A0A820KYY3_9BILA|nr:unnamed protein product [Rotaria magnacalcarata]CAF4350690.1 unnamed protein product [Rotaria magnacalcarata]